LSALDRKVIHFISCTNQPLSIVEAPTFKSLLSQSDRDELKGRRHYTEYVLPRAYDAVRNVLMKRLDYCSAISFTTDIWTGPPGSFISLTAHGIDSEWSRVKLVLCVREFPGSHTAGAIEKMVGEMLAEWKIPREKVHVFVRDQEANMIKAGVLLLPSSYSRLPGIRDGGISSR
jgi:hypothetical protein